MSADGHRRGERRALSVRRPWANLIFGGKTVENRSWPTRYRGPLVIHAGTTWEPDGAALATRLAVPGVWTPACCPGGYLGTVRLVDVHQAAVHPDDPDGPDGPDGPGVARR